MQLILYRCVYQIFGKKYIVEIALRFCPIFKVSWGMPWDPPAKLVLYTADLHTW